MMFHDLPMKHKKTAIQWAVESWKNLYNEQGIDVEVSENSPEVKQSIEDAEYMIECGEYERGIKYERLVRL